MKEQFTEWRPSRKTAELLALVTQVIDDYQAQGYQLTLRQLYYQLVSRGVIPNEQRRYKKLGEIMTNARLAGLVDWDAIVDRGRSPVMAAQCQALVAAERAGQADQDGRPSGAALPAIDLSVVRSVGSSTVVPGVLDRIGRLSPAPS